MNDIIIKFDNIVIIKLDNVILLVRLKSTYLKCK